MRRLTAVFFMAALAACGREKEAPAAPPAGEPAPPAGEVAATDEFGPFDTEIADIAFWTHPNVAFQGLVLIAGGDGLYAFNVEDGDEVSRLAGFSASGVEVVYDGAGAEARGIAILADETSGELRFFDIDNETRAITERPAENAPAAAPFCAGVDRDGDLRLVTIEEFTLRTHRLNASAASITVTAGEAARAPEPIIACAADPLDGSAFLAGASGKVYALAPGGEVRPFADTGARAPGAIGLALNGLVEGGPTEECCGQLALLDGSNASVRFFDREDGRFLGAVTISASFDLEAVSAAVAMGVGYGNFGAIYRDGVLALATDGEAPAVRLVPLNGVMDTLGVPYGPAAEPRRPAPQEEAEDTLVIDVNLVNE